MTLMEEFKKWRISHIILGITFIISGLVLNTIQLILFLLIRPFSKDIFRQINFYLLYSSWSQLVCLAEWWSGTEIRIHTEPKTAALFGKEHALLVMNHNYEIEWLMGWIVGDRCGVLGNCRVYAKNILKYVPVIGWSWALSDMIFLDRNWSKDCIKLVKSLHELCSYTKTVWILIFCEGTRFTKKKHEISLKFAKERGLPLLKHHLVPRTKGFVFSVKNLKGKFPALYDITLGFSPKYAEPGLKNLLMGKKHLAKMYIRRIPLDEIPTDSEEDCSNYLYNLYAEKDKILDDYFTTGKFPLEAITLERRPYSLLNFILWACIIILPSLCYVYHSIIGGSYMIILFFVLFILLINVAIDKMMSVTESSKGSSYGSKSSFNSKDDGNSKKD